MPFKDKERARQYHREYKRLQRAGVKPCQTLPGAIRLKTAQDVLALLDEQVARVKRDPEARSTEAARTIGYLCGIALKACEIAGLEARLTRLEEVLGIEEVEDAAN